MKVMHNFSIALKVLAPILVLVAALHLSLGSMAEVMLGASLKVGPLDLVLDSQDRFYGTAFVIYGVLLWVCAKDVTKYALILRCVFCCCFVAGLARLVSFLVVGPPPVIVMFLWFTEVAMPPIMLWWLSNILNKNASPKDEKT
jgi:Domain of unknown function (DUF4345)